MTHIAKTTEELARGIGPILHVINAHHPEQLEAFRALCIADYVAGLAPVATKLETPQFQSFRADLLDAKRLAALPTGTKLYALEKP